MIKLKIKNNRYLLGNNDSNDHRFLLCNNRHQKTVEEIFKSHKGKKEDVSGETVKSIN